MKDKIHHYDLLEEMLRNRDQQLILQAKEYERRLEGLNGEAGRLRNMQETYLLKSTYETNVGTQNDKFDRAINQINDKFEASIRELRKDIKDIADWKVAELGKDKGRDSLTKYVPWMISSLISAIALVFMYLSYKK